MQTRNVGRSGLRVSLLGLGCNNFGGRLDGAATKAVVHQALDLGVTLFDTASNYGEGRSEALLGEALGQRRQDIVLASKFGTRSDDPTRTRDGSRRFILHSVERSLKALGTDWIDLYQLHWPDPTTPIEETLRAADDLIRQGKVRYIGCSNMPAWQVVEAHWVARSEHLSSFISCQDEYSLIARAVEHDLVPAMESYGLGMLTYSPLAAGMLTGKYRLGARPPQQGRLASAGMYADKFLTENTLRTVAELTNMAEGHGLSLTEFALRWLAAQPVVSSIVAAAMTPEQLTANVQSLDGELPPELIADLDRTPPKTQKRDPA